MTRFYSSTAQPTTLSAGCTDTATSIQVTATTGFPAVEFILALDYGASQQELVKVTAVAGTTLTVVRGFDSTTAQAHSLGAVVRHVHSADDFRLSRTHESASSGIHGATGALVGTTDAQALTNKDLTAGTNTFPTSLATTSGAQTLTNKAVALGSNTVTGTTAQFNAALTDDDFATLTNTATLTNKTVNLTSNTLAGTTAQFNAALSDNDFATLAGAETLTNKTLTSPTVNSPTIDSPTITGSVTMNSKIQSGFTTVDLVASNQGTKAVTFPVAFASAPRVVASSANGDLVANVQSVTTTGCTLTLYRPAGAVTFTGTVTWIAVAP